MRPSWSRGPRAGAWLTLAACQATTSPPSSLDPVSSVAPGDVTAYATGVFGHADGAVTVDGVTFDLAPGPVTWVHPTSTGALAFVWGQGVVRLSDGVAAPADGGLDAPALGLLAADARPTPTASATAPDGTIWLTTVGGLFRSDDDGASWSLVDTSSSGTFPVLLTDVEAWGSTVVVTAVVPDSLLPADFAGLITGTVLASSDGGETWDDRSADLPSASAAAVGLGPAGLWVGTRDRGLFQWTGAGWSAVGAFEDVTHLEATSDGWVVVTAHGASWLLDRQGQPVAALLDDAVGADGPSLADAQGRVQTVAPASGRAPVGMDAPTGSVTVALSFHVNFYHSYRGDAPTDDGFGVDIDVIRTTLDWLDAHPEVHADWDIENAFTLDDWMPEFAPDILSRLQERVASGQDDVRLMSWNNGAMAASTPEEFDLAVTRGLASNLAAFGRTVPGVQPQECMVTPDHADRYASHGLQWITLFDSATGFTALRPDLDLGDGVQPFRWVGPAGGEIVVVPVVHHADVLDHGGLLGWVRQLRHDHDRALLVVHFDADAESWQRFDRELDALAGEPGVSFDTIQGWLDGWDGTDAPTYEIPDLADGTGDGFQSWAEKAFNHELYTSIARARASADAARALGAGDPVVEDALAAALEPRVLSLSTTHFGLAAPILHPDRVASALAFASAAQSAADDALSIAEGLAPVPAGTVQIVQPRQATGPALIDLTVEVPSSWMKDGTTFVLTDPTGAQVPTAIRSTVAGEPTVVVAQAIVDVVPGVSEWTWSWGAPTPWGLSEADAPTVPTLGGPFTTCDGARADATSDADALQVDPSGSRVSISNTWAVGVCGAPGTVVRTITSWAGLPGVVVEIDGALGGDDVVDGLQEVALTPFVCTAPSEITWPGHGGGVHVRPARSGVASWNGQAADGWVAVACAEGDLVISHRVTDRTSMAFAPLRNLGAEGLIAPLGTLWGPGPWHDGASRGGLGLGDVVVPIVGSQFHPAAPDWGGEAVTYRLLVGDATIDEPTRDLFAHPPHVRVGS